MILSRVSEGMVGSLRNARLTVDPETLAASAMSFWVGVFEGMRRSQAWGGMEKYRTVERLARVPQPKWKVISF
jgi:hypothetical protein